MKISSWNADACLGSGAVDHFCGIGDLNCKLVKGQRECSKQRQHQWLDDNCTSDEGARSCGVK